MELCDLPDAVFWHMLSFLPVEDVCTVRATCRKAKELVHNEAGVWQKRCRACGVTSLRGWNAPTYRELYLTLIHKYGSLVGLWSGQVEAVGSLLEIALVPPSLCGWAVVPRLLNGPNMRLSVFQLTMTGPGRVSVQCMRPGRIQSPSSLNLAHMRSHAHPATIRDMAENSFEFSCSDQCQQAGLEPRSRLMAAVAPCDPEPACVWPEITRELRDLQLLQYIISHQALWDGPDEDDASGNSICYRRISRPEGRHSLEGLWKGSYGGHGLEIISVRLSSDGQMLLGTKITADPNVHHSELTFRVHLTRPIDRAGDLLEQPQQEHAFALPVNFTTDVEFTGAPSLQLIGRYEAEGQVARKGFREAKWVALHFTEFAGGAFGVTWLTLNTFSMFVRLQLPGTDAPFLEDLSVLPQDG